MRKLTDAQLDKIRKDILKSKEYLDKSNKLLKDVYSLLENSGIDLERYTNAENADNLEQAISCFVDYNEYSINGIMEEIELQNGR